MQEYSLAQADFDEQKRKIKEFAEQPATSTELGKFNTNGQFDDFLIGGIPGLLAGHKVTGKEINELVAELQSCFAEINERDRKVIEEFGQIYKTFEALDKGYIQGIIASVKSAEYASKEAKNAQKDIDDTFQLLQKVVSKLIQFKDDMKSHKHLDDIDDMWLDIQRINGQVGYNCTKIDDIICEMQKYNSDVEKTVVSLKDSVTSLNKENLALKNKIKIAFAIAASAVGLSVIQLVLSVMRII